MSDAARRHVGPGTPLKDRVAELLRDAEAAEAAGDWRLRQTLLAAIGALDPGNAEVARLLSQPAARRLMTLLFCDIVGSTELADSRDPEEVTEVLSLYRRTCDEVIEAHDGFVHDRRGDGMLVLFGYPQVEEDDSSRAVACALEIVERLGSAFAGPHGAGPGGTVPVHVRVAVHTGPVVVSDVGISGSTANEASRLQELAEPDMVVVSDTTRHMVESRFETESLGTHRLRGVSRPVELFAVRARRTGGLNDPTPGAIPFVGRQAELARLLVIGREALRAPSDGSGKAVLVVGPPGIGKTRLVRQAVTALAAGVTAVAGSRLHQNATLEVLRPALASALGIHPSDDPITRRDRIRARSGSTGLAPGYDLPFLGSVFDIPPDLLDAPPDIDPTALREHGLALAADLMRDGQAPRVLFVDDLHWADQGTLDVLALVLQSPRPGMFLVMAAREPFTPPGPVQATLELGPLATADMLEMAGSLHSGAELPDHALAELVERSDGVPLFLEELVHTEVTVGTDTAHHSLRYGSHRIPPALWDPLLARLTVPGVDVELAQVAAVIGREADPDVLRSAVGAGPGDFERRVGTLVDAGILEYDEGKVRFRHELIREVAYDTQRRATAQRRHGWLADHIGSSESASTRAVSEEIAFHCERALRYDEAVRMHLRVAEADVSVGSHVQAVQRLTHVLGLLEQMVDGPGRSSLELTARGLRSFSVVMANGYAAPEAAEDHARCVELCRALRPEADVVPFLVRSWSYYALRGELAHADEVTGTIGTVIEKTGGRFPARAAFDGVVRFFRGDFVGARDELEAFVTEEWAHTPGTVPRGWPLPNDPLAVVYAHLAPILHIFGEPAAAAQAASDGATRAASLPFPYGPFTELYVELMRAMTLNLAGDHAAAVRLSQQLMTRAENHGFGIWRLAGLLNLLLNCAQAGDARCCDQLTSAVGTWRYDLAADAWTPYWLTGLAVAEQRLGRLAAARSTFDVALDVAARTGAGFFSAEALRGRGEVRLALGERDGATDVEAALRLARSQRAVLFERRAAAALEKANAG